MKKFLLVLSLVFSMFFSVGFVDSYALVNTDIMDVKSCTSIEQVESYINSKGLYFFCLRVPKDDTIVYYYSVFENKPTLYLPGNLQITYKDYCSFDVTYSGNSFVSIGSVSSFSSGSSVTDPSWLFSSNYDLYAQGIDKPFFSKPKEPLLNKSLVTPVMTDFLGVCSKVLPVGLVMLSLILGVSLIKRLVALFL